MATIFVVDDNDDIRELMVHWLRQAGHTVLAAADPFMALVTSEPPTTFDLVVLDVDMPGMDGFALLRHLRAHRPSLPVVFVSGRPWAQDLSAAAGIRCLRKPFTDRDLVDAVRDGLAVQARAASKGA